MHIREMTPLATVNIGGLSEFVQPYHTLFRDERPDRLTEIMRKRPR